MDLPTDRNPLPSQYDSGVTAAGGDPNPMQCGEVAPVRADDHQPVLSREIKMLSIGLSAVSGLVGSGCGNVPNPQADYYRCAGDVVVEVIREVQVRRCCIAARSYARSSSSSHASISSRFAW